MDCVGLGVAIPSVEVQADGDDLEVFFFASEEVFELTFDDAVLDLFPIPAGIELLVVGHKGAFAVVRGRDEANADSGLRGGLSKFGDEVFRIEQHVGDALVHGRGLIGFESEAIVDSEQDGDEFGRASVAAFLEVALNVGFVLRGLTRGENKRAFVGLAGFGFARVVAGEKPFP